MRPSPGGSRLATLRRMKRRVGALGFLLTFGCFDPPSNPTAGTEGSSGPGTGGGPAGEGSSDGASLGSSAGMTTSRPGTSGAGSTSAVGASTGGFSETASSSETTDAPVVPLDCVEGLLDPPVGAPVVEAELAESSSRFDGSCGTADTAELAFQWVAPSSGFYIFDTEGSAFDTVLYLTEAECEAPQEIACNDNAPGVASSRIVAEVARGDARVVAVEARAGETGSVVVNVREADCPVGDLAGVTFPQTFSNVTGSDAHASACGGADEPERTFRYTAPASGLYRITASSQDFPPVLSVEDGPVCGGTALQCNPPTNSTLSEVIRRLTAGQHLTLFVDSLGGTGEFSLDIETLENAQCPQNVLEGEFSGTITAFEHRMSASCGPVGESLDGEIELFEAATFGWTSPGPQGTNSGCTLLYSGGFPAVLSLQEGSCDGPETQCVQASINEESSAYEAEVEVGHIPPTDFTVTVARAAGQLVPNFGNDFTVRVQCWAIA